MNTKKLTLSAVLVALGTLLGAVIFIPLGVAKLYPVQHFINIIAAVLLGPFNAVLVAFTISLLRNILATGSLLAFPGSMIGALFAGLFFSKTKCAIKAGIGELIGTGIIGAILSYPIALLYMGKKFSIFYFVIPFFLSSLAGTIIAIVLLNTPALKNVILNKGENIK